MSSPFLKVGIKQSIENWDNSIDEHTWNKQKNRRSENWHYANLLKDPIYYNTNTFGYRTPEFQFDNDYALAFGCSNTYGLFQYEKERYSNLLEDQLNIPVYNLGISGGSTNIILMNVLNLITSGIKLPKLVVIQWPKQMRLCFPYEDISPGVASILAEGVRSKIFKSLMRYGNLIEYNSLWAKETTIKMLDLFNIKTVEFALEDFTAAAFDVPHINRIDTAFDNQHIGPKTNKEIVNLIGKEYNV